MTDMFDAPSSGVKITDFEGALMLVKPLKVEEGIQTAYGASDATRVDVIVLDGDQSGEYADLLVFPRKLQGQLRGKVGTGRYVLGRLGKGVAQPGQSAPWILGDPTDADKATARSYLEQSPQAPF